jgi:hypothetical protein
MNILIINMKHLAVVASKLSISYFSCFGIGQIFLMWILFHIMLFCVCVCAHTCAVRTLVLHSRIARHPRHGTPRAAAGPQWLRAHLCCACACVRAYVFVMKIWYVPGILCALWRAEDYSQCVYYSLCQTILSLTRFRKDIIYVWIFN